LKYYEDLRQRIPREEATQLANRVEKAAKAVVDDGDVLKVVTCGSYRRGAETCGDVDILITRTDDESVQGLCEKVVARLEKEGFLKERLGKIRHSEKGSQGYFGIG